MTPSIATWRPWPQRLCDAAREALRRWPATRNATPLRGLDAQTLRDIGLDASEIDSVSAESHGLAAMTRRRIVGRMHHV